MPPGRDLYFTILPHLITVLIASGVSAVAADFNLDYNGATPVSLRSELTYEDKGVRLVATARNDSGSAAKLVRICILSRSVKSGCLFEIWNTSTLKNGESLTWNLYLPYAIRSLVAQYPDLVGKTPDGKIALKVRLYKAVRLSEENISFCERIPQS